MPCASAKELGRARRAGLDERQRQASPMMPAASVKCERTGPVDVRHTLVASKDPWIWLEGRQSLSVAGSAIFQVLPAV